MTKQTRIQYEVRANLRVTYSLHQNTDIYWHSVPMSVEGEQTSQFQNELSWSNMPLFHLFETQFHSTYNFLKLSPVGPYLSIKNGGGGGTKKYLVPKQKQFSLTKPCYSLPQSILILGHPFCPFFYYKVGFYCKNSPKFKSNLRFRLCTRIMILLLFPKLVWPA